MAFINTAALVGVTGWWRASSLVGNKQGDDILTWTSEAPGSYTLTGLAGATGKYQENQLNGLPALLFDGNNDTMTSSVNWSSLLAAGGIGSVVMLWKPVAMPGVGTTVGIFGGDALSTPSLYLSTAAGPVYTLTAFNNDGGIETTPAPGDTRWQISIWQHGSYLRIYQNDAYFLVSQVASGASVVLGQKLTVASRNAGYQFANILVAEVLTISTSPVVSIAGQQLGNICAYLAAKYFSAGVSDTDHHSPLIRANSNEQVRNVLTRRLMARERRDRRVLWTGGLALLNYQIGDNVLLAHPLGPDVNGVATQPPGWPDTKQGQRPHRIIGIAQTGDTTVQLTMEPL
jgi:hypothetical protein